MGAGEERYAAWEQTGNNILSCPLHKFLFGTKFATRQKNETKNRNMNKLIFSLLFISFGFIAHSQTSGKLMPVTASSETALSLYNKAVEYYDAVHIEKAIESFNDALNKDADLFG